MCLQAHEEQVGWFCRRLSFLWSLSVPQPYGQQVSTALPSLGLLEIVQLRVVLINERAD